MWVGIPLRTLVALVVLVRRLSAHDELLVGTYGPCTMDDPDGGDDGW